MKHPSPRDEIKWLKTQKLKTVRVHAMFEFRHPDAKIRFTCQRFPMLHGTFWRSYKAALADEQEGKPACAMCAALAQEGQEVEFETFEAHVKSQRALQKRAADRAGEHARRARNQGSRYAG